MKSFHRLILVATVTMTMTGAPALMAPAQACMGPVCDSICHVFFTIKKACPVR
jgi:hypothetical protein